MPKRTNEFQKLIYLIQHQLSDDAIVTESKLLLDNTTGKNVEVDIVVDTQKAGISIVIGFECTAKKRPATVEWVNEMFGKHQGLPTDKVVLVSKSGFTKTALERAEMPILKQ